MKSILITGGAGFIGSNFISYIFENYPGYKIIVLDALTYAGNMNNIPVKIKKDSRFEFWHGNVRNAELVNELIRKSNIVVHMAAETHVARSIFDNYVFFETDVLGTQVVANAVLKYSKTVERFIHISTSEIYGSAIETPMTENHPLNPTTPYASAKVGADRLVYSYWITYGIPAIIIRPFNNYGPYQHLEKVIPRFITSCILNEPLTIHGNGKCSRDWLFVEDHCEALDKAIHADINKIKGEVINIGTLRDIDIITIANMIVERMGRPKDIITHIGDRPGQVQKHIASTAKAEQLLRWKAKTKFEEGLEKTIKWYVENRKWWEPLIWMRKVPVVTKEGKVEMH